MEAESGGRVEGGAGERAWAGGRAGVCGRVAGTYMVTGLVDRCVGGAGVFSGSILG